MDKLKKNQEKKFSSLKEKGQMSIFLGITLVVVTTFIAFIINVGLFVKAKINLQNAVDSAAFSGASVQARQLTNIAYMNWEIRNVFKEWMFKYYILGQKGNKATWRANILNPSFNNGGRMNFRLRPFWGPSKPSKFDPSLTDKFNAPTICIDYGSSHNICDTVSVPGLPRFNTVGLPSISEHHESFLNSIVASKAEDCSSRSNVNMGAAMLWTYGTGKPNLFPGVPEIASDRIGGWVKALELGMRMRNLEKMVNTAPISNYMCQEPGSSPGCSVPIASVEGQYQGSPNGERAVKAFTSAYRNLAGGVNKVSSSADFFAASFKLAELPPTPFEAPEQSLSGFLIPPTSGALTKHYLDLQVYPVNYAIFYTSFVSDTGTFKNTGGDPDVASEADCGGVKTALPVPGYIVGYTKNPEVMTYYAVKGEANFVGLFFPFTEASGITLSAYAAAKPMGGRIGPKLFNINNNRNITPRTGGFNKYTADYAIGVETAGLNLADVGAGYPIPLTTDFWARGASQNTIGGLPNSGDRIFFAIPSMIYEVADPGGFADLNSAVSSDMIDLTTANTYALAYGTPNEGSGLYNANQFNLFEQNQIGSATATMTSNEVIESINNIRKPTRYEALNYLIPVKKNNFNESPLNTVKHNGFIYATGAATTAGGQPSYNLYGPLKGNNNVSIYGTSNAAIISVVQDYIKGMDAAIQAYIDALKEVADNMRLASAASAAGDAYEVAANSIHSDPIPFPAGKAPSDPMCTTMSMAQKFSVFFDQNEKESCGVVSLPQLMREYIEKLEAEGKMDRFNDTYTRNGDAEFQKTFLTAYTPGKRQGAETDGNSVHPFNGSTELDKRNFYSVKFVGIEGLANGDYLQPVGAYLEGSSGQNFQTPTDLIAPMSNTLDTTELNEFNNKFHY